MSSDAATSSEMPPQRAVTPRVAWVCFSPTPYHMPFFDYLHQTGQIELHVLFCTGRSRQQAWELDHDQTLNIRVVTGRELSCGRFHFNSGVLAPLWREHWDAVVVSGYTRPTMQAAIMVCVARGIPFILQGDTHLLKPRPWIKRTLKRWLLYPVLRRCGAAIGTGILAKRYWESMGIPEDRVFIVGLTSHLGHFRRQCEMLTEPKSTLRATLGIAPEQVTGIYVGRLIEIKGLDLLLLGMAELEPSCCPHLIIVGQGPERERLEGLVSDYGLPVHFTGFCQNESISQLFAAADFFVLPSRQEPWGVVVAEAMAAGLPIMLSEHVGAGYDLLQEGRNGWFVRGGRSSHWQAALGRSVELAADLPSMGKASREIIGGWNRDAAAQQFFRALEVALARQHKK